MSGKAEELVHDQCSSNVIRFTQFRWSNLQLIVGHILRL